jgi:hypothetical protein
MRNDPLCTREELDRPPFFSALQTAGWVLPTPLPNMKLVHGSAAPSLPLLPGFVARLKGSMASLYM